MYKKSLFFSLLLVAALLLSACAGAAPAAPAQAPAAEATEAAAAGEAAQPAAAPDVDTTGLNLDAAGTFSYWNGFTASDRPVMEENVRVFDELYPNVTVNMDIQPWDSILPKLLPSMRSGSDPDVVSLDASFIPQYVKAGVLKPVDDLWGEGGIDPARFSEGVLQGMTVDGKRYGAPIIYFTTLLYMNNDLFTAAGLPAECPADWAAWQDALLKLTVDENSDGTPEQYGMSWSPSSSTCLRCTGSTPTRA